MGQETGQAIKRSLFMQIFDTNFSSSKLVFSFETLSFEALHLKNLALEALSLEHFYTQLS